MRITSRYLYQDVQIQCTTLILQRWLLPPKYSDDDRRVICRLEDLKLLKTQSRMRIGAAIMYEYQKHSQPAQEIQLHATSIVDARSISPCFRKIARYFRDGILWDF